MSEFSMIPETIEYREYRYRWVILSVYCLGNAMNSTLWITFSPITTETHKTYGVDVFWVEMCSLISMFIYPILVFPALYALDKYGLRFGITIGAIFNTIGGWIRVGGYDNFWYILTGSVFVGMAQPFLLTAPSKLSAFWFRPEARTMSTTIGWISNPLGIIVGFVLPGIFVMNESKTEIGNLMLIEAILSTISCILVVFFFRAKPEIPPSRSAEVERVNFKQALPILLKNKNYLLLLIYFSAGIGTQNTLATIIELIGKPYGFSSAAVSLFAALNITFGLIGDAIATTIITKTLKFKLFCLSIGFISLIGFGVFTLTLPIGSIAVTAASSCLIGFLLMPMIPISYELGCELTFPIGEAMAGGLLNCGGTIFGIIEVGIAYLFSNQPIASCVICIIALLIGTVSIFFVKEDLKRIRQEKEPLNEINHSEEKQIKY